MLLSETFVLLKLSKPLNAGVRPPNIIIAAISNLFSIKPAIHKPAKTVHYFLAAVLYQLYLARVSRLKAQ